MAYKMFAAIYVGSSEISMKIFQVMVEKRFVRSTVSAGYWSLGGTPIAKEN